MKNDAKTTFPISNYVGQKRTLFTEKKNVHERNFNKAINKTEKNLQVFRLEWHI